MQNQWRYELTQLLESCSSISNHLIDLTDRMAACTEKHNEIARDIQVHPSCVYLLLEVRSPQSDYSYFHHLSDLGPCSMRCTAWHDPLPGGAGDLARPTTVTAQLAQASFAGRFKAVVINPTWSPSRILRVRAESHLGRAGSLRGSTLAPNAASLRALASPQQCYYARCEGPPSRAHFSTPAQLARAGRS